jgi:hypothetical protein
MPCLDLQDRIYNQYRNKPKAGAWYQITRTLGDKLCSVYSQIRATYDVETATGVQLDVIGRVVGVSREYIYQEIINYVQFGGTSAQFGGTTSQFNSALSSFTDTVDDDLYRLIIKSKIYKNNQTATYDDIITALDYVIPNNEITVINGSDMTFSVNFGVPLTTAQALAMDNFPITPEPQGTKFTGYTEI